MFPTLLSKTYKSKRAVRGRVIALFYFVKKKGRISMISNSGHDENGRYSGGKAGDQGGEWVIQSWYNRPWSCILRHPDKKVREEIAKLARAAALNNKIGYDQNQRTTFWNQLKKVGYDPAKITVACEADCSAGVAAIVKAVGYRLDIDKLKNVSEDAYTGNLRAVLKNAGFECFTESKYRTSSSYLLKGDVLLYDGHHTCINLDNSGKAGGSSASDGILRKGDSGSTVKTMQTKLIACGYSCGPDGADGDFGSDTLKALKKFQTAYKLEVDGEYGPKSKAKLEAVYKEKTASVKKSVTEIAQEVMNGKWGNGDTRKKKLEAAGYNYSEVQKKVNELAK